MKKAILISILSALVIVVGAVAIAYNMPEKPLMLSFVEEKLQSIVTPKAPIGNLTPARDLRGTWKSSIAGKGLQLFGQFVNGPTTTTIYGEEDIELIIDKVDGNIATGKTKTSACIWGVSTAPVIGIVQIPKTCSQDADYQPMTIRVSGSSLDFGNTVTAGGSVNMQGGFTTDIISGSATVTTPYGLLKGALHLSRVQ